MCISSGRTTFDGARQRGHATDTPLRRLIDRATSAVANESEHDAHIAWEHSKTVASAVSLSSQMGQFPDGATGVTRGAGAAGSELSA